MKIEDNKVVTFHYSVSEGDRAIESSRDRGEPLAILFGKGNIIPGLEAALREREAGDRFEVEVAPEEAYGEHRADFVQRVAKKYFHDPEHLKPGMTTVLNTREGGRRPVTVLKIGSSVIDVDLNHPLAGKSLRFDVEIVDVRDATPEEIEHRHAHGTGGHDH